MLLTSKIEMNSSCLLKLYNKSVIKEETKESPVKLFTAVAKNSFRFQFYISKISSFCNRQI